MVKRLLNTEIIEILDRILEVKLVMIAVVNALLKLFQIIVRIPAIMNAMQWKICIRCRN